MTIMPKKPRFFLGVDTGGTKTHALIADEHGQAVGFGAGGPGNHESVGYEGFTQSLNEAVRAALDSAGITRDHINGAGFGVAGYDWPYEKPVTYETIATLGLKAPLAAVNDTVLGILAGSPEGWGVAVVSGTGCNCWGWDHARTREGHVTGGGILMGEGAGATELVFKAVQAVAHAWTGRGPATSLSQAFAQYTGAASIDDLIQGLMGYKYQLDAAAAPVIFKTAGAGDTVAEELIRWAGTELGELANAVIRQLNFEPLEFDVVQIGSMYDGSPLLTQSMRQKIHTVAPKARLVRLTVPPVVGAVLLGMEQVGIQPDQSIRHQLAESIKQIPQNSRPSNGTNSMASAL
ncbi:MAG: ATPase [Chloroflexota bacterium]|nr:MAG: ATPase [Chloroflexota bacterium]